MRPRTWLATMFIFLTEIDILNEKFDFLNEGLAFLSFILIKHCEIIKKTPAVPIGVPGKNFLKFSTTWVGGNGRGGGKFSNAPTGYGPDVFLIFKIKYN